MKRWLIVVALGLSAACSGGTATSPTTPAATRATTNSNATFTLTGTVAATNGGQAVSGASVALGNLSTSSDASGHFSLTAPVGMASETRLTITGASLVDRLIFVTPTTHNISADAIVQDGTFSLDFYRQLVRNNLEEPGV